MYRPLYDKLPWVSKHLNQKKMSSQATYHIRVQCNRGKLHNPTFLSFYNLTISILASGMNREDYQLSFNWTHAVSWLNMELEVCLVLVRQCAYHSVAYVGMCMCVCVCTCASTHVDLKYLLCRFSNYKFRQYELLLFSI